jgi:hypothetical protein
MVFLQKYGSSYTKERNSQEKQKLENKTEKQVDSKEIPPKPPPWTGE